jgi:TctA family transporter
MLIGVPCGLLAGALPGIGGAAALAILFPLTYTMNLYQGSSSCLPCTPPPSTAGPFRPFLIRTPGTGAAEATILDGYPMARNGLPARP